MQKVLDFSLVGTIDWTYASSFYFIINSIIIISFVFYFFMISLTLLISLLYLLLLIFFINIIFIIFINIIFISIVYSIIIHFLAYSSWTKKPKTFLDGGWSKTDWLLLLKRLYWIFSTKMNSKRNCYYCTIHVLYHMI